MPQTDWPWFRATCRDTLDADAFALVDDYYLKVLRAVRSGVAAEGPRTGNQLGWDTGIRPAVLDALTPLLPDLRSRSQGIVALRAAQAALIPLGALLRAEVEPFLQTLTESHRPPALTTAQWRSMRAYRDPWRPMTAALQLSGMRAAVMFDLTCEEVAAARSRGDRVLRDTDINPDGWEYVMAQFHLRSTEGASPEDLLLNMNRSAVPYARRALRNDFGIAFGAEERGLRNESLMDTWLKTVRRRLTLSDIR